MSTVASVTEFSFYLSSEIDLPVRACVSPSVPYHSNAVANPLHTIPAVPPRMLPSAGQSQIGHGPGRPRPSAGRHQRQESITDHKWRYACR